MTDLNRMTSCLDGKGLPLALLGHQDPVQRPFSIIALPATVERAEEQTMATAVGLVGLKLPLRPPAAAS